MGLQTTDYMYSKDLMCMQVFIEEVVGGEIPPLAIFSLHLCNTFSVLVTPSVFL